MRGHALDSSRVFKVRAFDATIKHDGVAPWLVKGEVREGGYVLSIVEMEFNLRTTVVDWDERGPFAMIREVDTPHGTWLLRIQADYDEPFGDIVLAPGCWIHYYQPGDRAWHEELVEGAGIDLDKVEVLVPVRSPGFSIYFDSDGEYESVSFPGGVHSGQSGLHRG